MSFESRRFTLWLAYPSTPKGGIDRVLDEIDALGVGACLSVRIGQAGRIENGVDEKFLERVIARIGLSRTEIWWGSHPTTTADETRLAMRYHRLGVRRFVVNAETAWKRPGADEIAAKYSAELLRYLPDSEVWHAPFALLQSHGTGPSRFPYLGFASLHGMFLQWYPNEFGGRRSYWAERYLRERTAYLAANPSVARQKIVTMGDLYGSDFGRSWGLTPAAVKWADTDFDSWLDVSKGDPELALYSIDAALSEGDRTASKPWACVQRWAAKQRADQSAETARAHAEAQAHYSETESQCVDPRAMQACYSRADHTPEE